MTNLSVNELVPQRNAGMMNFFCTKSAFIMLSHGHFWKMACHEGLFIYHGLLLPVVGYNGCPIRFFLNFYGQPWRSNILNIIFFSSHLFAARTVPWVVARGSLQTNTTKKMLHSSISSHGGLVFRCPFRTAAEPGWSDEWMVLGTRVFGSSRFPCPSRTVRCFFQSPFLDSRQQSRRKPLYIALRSGGLKQEICVYCLHAKAQPLFKPMIFVASPDAFDPSGPMMLAAGM